jgi:hypothetical protein
MHTSFTRTTMQDEFGGRQALLGIKMMPKDFCHDFMLCCCMCIADVTNVLDGIHRALLAMLGVEGIHI